MMLSYNATILLGI